MGDESKFSEKWDFRRKENNFDDSSSDDPDSNSTQNPIIDNPNRALDPNQLENGTRKQPAKTRKRRSKKDESKPEKPKQARGRKPKTVCEEKKEETVMPTDERGKETKEKEETVMPTDEVGMFMKTLIDELTASRDSLMDWVKTELYGSDQNVASRPPVKKRAVTAVAVQRPVKKRMTKKKEEEEKESEKQSKIDNISQEMNKSKEIAQNSGDQVPTLDCNAGPLDSYLRIYKEMDTSKDIVQNGGEQVQELDCNAGPLDSYLRVYQEMDKSKEIAQNDGDQVQALDCNAGPLNSYLGSSQEMNKPKEIARNGGDQVLELDYNAGRLNRFLKSGQEMNKPEKIAQNGGDQVQELDYNAGPLNRFLTSGQEGLGRNYFQQQQEGQEGIVAQTEMVNEKNETVMNQKSIVLAIKAPILNEKQKKMREANTIKNRSLMVEGTVSETQNVHNFAIPYAPKQSSLPSLQSYPVAPSLFPSSSQGIMSFASTNNFQLRQPPVVSQIPDLSEYQTGFTGGQGFGNSMFNNNGYLSGFSTAFQPNPIPGGYNFPAQVNPATSLQQRGNNNMFGGLRVAAGTIRFPDGRFPESEIENGVNGLSDYRTSSGR